MNLCEFLFKVSDITSQITVILDNFKAEISKMFGTSVFSMVYFEQSTNYAQLYLIVATCDRVQRKSFLQLAIRAS